jgi:hypothetical protein
VFGEEAVLLKRFLEAASVRQQLGQVIANNLLVVWLIKGTVRNGLFEIAE